MKPSVLHNMNPASRPLSQNMVGLLFRMSELLPNECCYTRWSHSALVRQQLQRLYVLIYPLIALGDAKWVAGTQAESRTNKYMAVVGTELVFPCTAVVVAGT
jgi:hypothetical protein